MLATTGLHSSLGRHTDPTEEEIRLIEAQLERLGLGGWLAIAEGDFYQPGKAPTLLEVKRFGSPAVDFTEAATLFERLRIESNGHCG